MEHLREYRAAADGKHHGNRASPKKAPALGFARRLIFAAAALLIASMWGSSSYAQSGPFAGMAGNWSGAGTVTLDDGSTERIRCRAAYAVGAGGNALGQRGAVHQPFEVGAANQGALKYLDLRGGGSVRPLL